jgi:hypothetical protein
VPASPAALLVLLASQLLNKLAVPGMMAVASKGFADVGGYMSLCWVKLT